MYKNIVQYTFIYEELKNATQTTNLLSKLDSIQSQIQRLLYTPERLRHTKTALLSVQTICDIHTQPDWKQHSCNLILK